MYIKLILGQLRLSKGYIIFLLLLHHIYIHVYVAPFSCKTRSKALNIVLQSQGRRCILYLCRHIVIWAEGQTERKPQEGRERNKIKACPAHDAPGYYFDLMYPLYSTVDSQFEDQKCYRSVKRIYNNVVQIIMHL